MTRRAAWAAGAAVLVVAACSRAPARPVEVAPATTSGAIAVGNLDHLIAQHGDEPGIEELLLTRSRFLADYDALERAAAIAEPRVASADDLVRRARTRSAVHRFADALADLAAAERAGANRDELVALRASIWVATGKAGDALPGLEAAAAAHPGFAAASALAGAYAAVGRFTDADRRYAEALAALDTSSPFPYAWIYFARGLMWTEQAHDPARGEAMYARALAHLPAFATASIHLAELEVARGDFAPAIARLERVVAASAEPEALALLGTLHIRIGDPARGGREIAAARQRFEALLARQPLAFADHAAEFYLGPGADPARAWLLAQQNLANRATDRAIALAIKAARAAGRDRELCELAARPRAATAKEGPPCRPLPPTATADRCRRPLPPTAAAAADRCR